METLAVHNLILGNIKLRQSLHGSLPAWQKKFFQYIIDNKFVAVAHIDENDVEKKWPSVPKQKLFKAALDFSKGHGAKGQPIHQNISENIHRLRPHEPPQEVLDFNEALERIGIKPFSKLRK